MFSSAPSVSADAPLDLYNLRQDIGETANVAAQNPKVMERIEGVFQDRADRADGATRAEVGVAFLD